MNPEIAIRQLPDNRVIYTDAQRQGAVITKTIGFAKGKKIVKEISMSWIESKINSQSEAIHGNCNK